MIKHVVLLAVLAFLLGGCTTFPPELKQSIKTAKSVAVVSALEPILVGQKVGITIFGNDGWIEENPDFDVNAAVLGVIKVSLNRDAKLVSGKDVDVVVSRNDGDAFHEKLKNKLASLGREWGSDYIILVHSKRASDFIHPVNSYLSVAGLGHYSAPFNGGAFCVLQATVFDCKTGMFFSSEIVKRERALSNVDWHFNWNEYTPEERRAILRTLTMVLNKSVPELLTSIGLNDTWKPAPPDADGVVDISLLEPFIPTGNEIDIPEGVTRESARKAVLVGFKEREWTVTADTEERIVGVYRDKAKEAICTATFTDRKIILAPEGHEIKADGTRVPVSVYERWHNNLKEVIAEFILKAPVG